MNRRRLWTLQARYAPYFFVAPFVLLFLVFMLYPLGRSVVMSLYKYAGPRTRTFVGLEHYAFFLTDKLLWLAVVNTVAYAVMILCLQIPASLGLALLLNSPRVRFRNAFRFAFFSSHLVGNVFVAVIFMLLLAQRHGRRCGRGTPVQAGLDPVRDQLHQLVHLRRPRYTRIPEQLWRIHRESLIE